MLRLTVFLAMLALLISACGNKGDLYLPTPDDDTATTQPRKP